MPSDSDYEAMTAGNRVLPDYSEQRRREEFEREEWERERREKQQWEYEQQLRRDEEARNKR